MPAYELPGPASPTPLASSTDPRTGDDVAHGMRSGRRWSVRRWPVSRRGVVTHIVLVGVVVFLAFPVVWAALSSFKTPADLYGAKPLPTHPTLENYEVAVGQFPVVRLLWNTVAMAVGVTIGQVLLSVLAAYAFAVFRFRGRKLVFWLVVVTILVPQQCLIIPNYIMTAQLGWLDTYAGLVVPSIATCAFGVLLLRQHMEAVPPSLLEAAQLDGARHRDTLWRVVVPAVRPAIGALAVLVFVTTWNEYMWPLLVTPGIDTTTIQVGLARFETQEGTDFGPMMAAATLATVPVLLAYLASHRRVTDAFLTSGIR